MAKPIDIDAERADIAKARSRGCDSEFDWDLFLNVLSDALDELEAARDCAERQAEEVSYWRDRFNQLDLQWRDGYAQHQAEEHADTRHPLYPERNQA